MTICSLWELERFSTGFLKFFISSPALSLSAMKENEGTVGMKKIREPKRAISSPLADFLEHSSLTWSWGWDGRAVADYWTYTCFVKCSSMVGWVQFVCLKTMRRAAMLT